MSETTRTPTQAEIMPAFTALTTAAGVAAEQLKVAFTALGEAVSRLYKSIAPLIDALPPVHGFTPNYDLACSTCSLGPEEHDG
jgi:hypothetical protein